MQSLAIGRTHVRPLTVALCLFALACSPRQNPANDSGAEEEESAMLVDRAFALGIDYRHSSGRTGKFYFPEIVGPGAALFDFDNDGDLDAYLVQGGALARADGSAAVEPREDRLYRNELVPTGKLRFVDVTRQSGIHGLGFGQGIAVADVDNDGWLDVYLASFPTSQLWKNQGDGTFRDVTEESGTRSEAWNTSASFVDFDRDGWLDLYVATYVNWRIPVNKECKAPSGIRDYCGPNSHGSEPDRLFRNLGGGRFEDVSGPAGIYTEKGSGLGVVAADFDEDGWPDIYVANDQQANFLWMNRRDGTFENRALLAGSAVDRSGQPQASMGVEAADFDRDGDDDLYLTHLDNQFNMFYRNDGEAAFEDGAAPTRLGPLSMGFTGFGTIAFDLENDGWLDLFVANGGVFAIKALVRKGDPFPYHQRNQLLRNRGDGTFEDLSAAAGNVLALSECSRGVAGGDVDNDGDVDLLVTNVDGPARLLLNRLGQRGRWAGVRLVEREPQRDVLGAVITMDVPGQRPLVRRVHTDGSYLSAVDPRVLFGLGNSPASGSIRVRWPSGERETWDPPPLGRYTTLVRGSGKPAPAS